jgi:type II secretory pathway pseudopilin PulG
MDTSRNKIAGRKILAGPEAGFTIVEIVFVILLMFLILYPLARVVANAVEHTTNQQHLTHCAFLAQLKLEETRTRLSCCTNGNIAVTSFCPNGAGIGGGTHNEFTSGFNYNQNPPNAYAGNCALSPLTCCKFPAPFTQYRCSVQTGNTPTNHLSYIQVQVWYDLNSNGRPDVALNEPNVILETLLTERPARAAGVIAPLLECW